MQELSQLIDAARQEHQKADHLIYMTYPVVKEIKLLIVAIDSIYKAVANCIEAVVSYEKAYKRIPPVKQDFKSDLRLFKGHCVKRYEIGKEILAFVDEVVRIADARKNSPVSFARGDSYVLCSHGYENLNKIDMQMIKKCLSQLRDFIELSERIIRQGDSKAKWKK